MLRPCKNRTRSKIPVIGKQRGTDQFLPCRRPSPTSEYGSSSETKNTLKLGKLLSEAFNREGNTSPWPATLNDKLPRGICCPARLSKADHRHWGTSASWAREALEDKGTTVVLSLVASVFVCGLFCRAHWKGMGLHARDDKACHHCRGNAMCGCPWHKGHSVPHHPFPRWVYQKAQAVRSRLVKAGLTFAFLAVSLKYERLKISCTGVAPGQWHC